MRADKWNTRRRDFPIGRDTTETWWSDLEWGQGGGQMIKSESKSGYYLRDQTRQIVTSLPLLLQVLKGRAASSSADQVSRETKRQPRQLSDQTWLRGVMPSSSSASFLSPAAALVSLKKKRKLSHILPISSSDSIAQSFFLYCEMSHCQIRLFKLKEITGCKHLANPLGAHPKGVVVYN